MDEEVVINNYMKGGGAKAAIADQLLSPPLGPQLTVKGTEESS